MKKSGSFTFKGKGTGTGLLNRCARNQAVIFIYFFKLGLWKIDVEFFC